MNIRLSPQYDSLSKAVQGTLSIDVPEVENVTISLFRGEAYNDSVPERTIVLTPNGETELIFSFTNMKQDLYSIKAEVKTPFQTHIIESQATENEVTANLKINKFMPTDCGTCETPSVEPHEHPDRRVKSIDNTILARFDSEKIEDYNNCEDIVKSITPEALKQLLTMDFSKDKVLLGGTGELVYLGGGNRLLVEISGEELLQSQNELTPKVERVIEARAENLLPPFRVSNNTITGWEITGKAETKLSILPYPFTFTNTLRIEAYNFTEESDLVLQSDLVKISDVNPLSIGFRAKLEIDKDIISEEVQNIQDIDHVTATIDFYTSWEEKVGEVNFTIEPADLIEYHTFHQIININDIPLNGTKARLRLNVGSLHPGNRVVLSVFLADINQVGTTTSPILGTSIREGDVYRVQWKDNFSFIQGAVLIDYIPTSDLSSVLFDTGTFKCTYNNKLIFTTEGSDLETHNFSIAWLEACISILTTPPTSPNIGDRYFTAEFAEGDWIHNRNQIAEWNGTNWIFTEMKKGECIKIANKYYTWDGSKLVANKVNPQEEGLVTIACCYGGGDTQIDRRIFLNGIEVALDSLYDPNINTMTEMLTIGCDSNRKNQVNGKIISFAIVPSYNPTKHKNMKTLPYALSQAHHS